MKNKTIQYRQGDVLIERCEKPTKKSKPAGKSVILAHGEATGHAHVLECDEIISRQDNDDGSFFLTFASDAEVVHQEHSTINLKRGTYRISRQREYSPQAIRNVAD